jgi:hypothetical protein
VPDKAHESQLNLSHGEAAVEREYKFVETSTVTDDELTRIVNEWTRAGWLFEGVQFAMREASKRPAMAFVLFTRRPSEIPRE